MIYCTQNMDV